MAHKSKSLIRKTPQRFCLRTGVLPQIKVTYFSLASLLFETFLCFSEKEDEPELVFPPRPKFPKLHAFNMKLQAVRKSSVPYLFNSSVCKI